jgi:hypothetical protein
MEHRMTLNLTALGREFVIQASDRRLTYVTSSGSIQLVDDDANKAVVFSCSDALLAITFTGLGKVHGTRVDEWLLDVMQEEALCELEAETAIEQFSQLATAWFQSFRSFWHGLHVFVFAGFQTELTSNRTAPRLWFVTNADSPQYSTFAVQSTNKPGTYVTGCLLAFTRTERRRLQAAYRAAKNPGQAEDALVDGIRNAASRAEGVSIGKNCMSVSLAPPRTAVSLFESPRIFRRLG